MARKRLTCKPLDPKKVRIIALCFIGLIVVNPTVRYHTGDAITSFGNFLVESAR